MIGILTCLNLARLWDFQSCFCFSCEIFGMNKEREVCLNNDMIVCQVDKNSMVLASLMSIDTNWSHLKEGNLIEKNVSIRVIFKIFLLINNCWGRVQPVCVVPSLI